MSVAYRISIEALLFLLLAFLAPVGNAYAVTAVPGPPSLSARSYILIDADSSQVLAEHDADARTEPASLTKMMTAYVVFSELKRGRIKLDDKVTVSKKAWRMPGSRMFLDVNSQVTVKQLLHGLLIQSGNDAAVALAEYVAGGERPFVDLMNQYAKKLGLTGTHYMDASGLPHPGHYSTARDVARLAQALIQHFPRYYRWNSIKQYTYNGITQRNRNRLLWLDDTVDGVKTGHTEAAGYCLVASAKRAGMRLIAAVMGAPSDDGRTKDAQSLLNYGYRFFETHKLYVAGQPVTQVRVWQGAAEKLQVGVGRDLYVTVPRGRYKDLDTDTQLNSPVVAPVTSGQVIGHVRVKLGTSVLAERPLVALAAMPRGNLWQRVRDYVLMKLKLK